jgi:AraC-like DNA-binding protein
MKTTLTGTFSATILKAFSSALGLDVRSVLAEKDDPGVGVDALSRVSLDVAFRIFDEAPHRTGFPEAGLVAARRTPPGALGIMDLLCRASPTIGESLANVGRYYPLIDDRTTVDFVQEGGLNRLVLRDRAEFPAPRAAREYLLGLIAVRWTELTARAIPAVRVSFTFPPPRDIEPYRSLFGADVRFGQPFTELLLDGSGLLAPVGTADPIVLSYVARQAEQALRHLPCRDGWLDGVRRAVRHGLAARCASLEATATNLALSARSLQRRLADAGTSYQDLLDSVRRELAIRWILEASVGIEEVAERLDFSEPASFHRAFRRWTGDSPRAYRQRLRG